MTETSNADSAEPALAPTEPSQNAAFEKVRQDFAASAQSLGVSPVELLRALSVPEFARINANNTWNAYQKYIKDNRVSELNRTFGRADLGE